MAAAHFMGVVPRRGGIVVLKHNGWDHGLTVTADGTGLIGHAGAVLLRKAADQAGLTAGLSSAFRQKNASPLLDRGAVLVSMAVAIALGAVSCHRLGNLKNGGLARDGELFGTVG